MRMGNNMTAQNFSELKLDDAVIVEIYEGYDNKASLYLGSVIKRSKTRLTVRYNGREQVFTNDGSVYPQERGYFHRVPRLMLATPKALYEQRLNKSRRFLFNTLQNLSRVSKDEYFKLNQNELDLMISSITKIANRLIKNEEKEVEK
jgi:hypothetical protein